MNNDELRDMSVKLIEIEMLNMQLENLGGADEGQGTQHDRSRLLHRLIQDHLNDLQEVIRIKINENTQVTLLNSFEIFGLPGDVETTKDIARILSTVLKVPIEDSDIRGFETIQTFRFQREEPICVPDVAWVVHMEDREDRDCILGLAGPDPVHLEGEEAPLYFAEHLTSMNKQILRRALQQGRALEYNKVWVSEGKIFARKTEASIVQQIHSDEDIDKMATFM